MVVDINGDGDEVKQKIQEIAVESACQEYSDNVRQMLNGINRRLDESLVENYAQLEEIEEKIAARTNYLEKNPNFLTSLNYTAQNIKIDALRELDEIKITLKEHSRRIVEKVEEIECYHQKLFELVMENSQEIINLRKMAEEIEEEMYQDCLDVGETKKKELVNVVEDKNEKTVGVVEAKIDLVMVVDPPTCEKPVKEHCSNRTEAKTEEAKQKLSSEDSFDKVTISKNAFSDVCLDSKTKQNLPENFHLFPDITPDVYRNRPFEDLHSRLLRQLEATDSLQGFIQMMQRKPSPKQKNHHHQKAKKADLIEDKYSGSLWFFSDKTDKNKKSTNTLSSPPSKKSSLDSRNSSCFKHLRVGSSLLSNQNGMRKTKSNLERGNLKYYDLLDDVDGNDLKPIKSEYPRKDNIGTSRYQTSRKSYLQLMLDENERVWKKLLLPPTAAQQQKNNNNNRSHRKKAEPNDAKLKEKKKSEKKLNESEKKSAEAKKLNSMNNNYKNVKNLMDYLTAPQQKFLNNRPRTLIVMPVKVVYDNFPTKELPEVKTTRVQQVKKSTLFTADKRKEMLEQLKSLKEKNGNIQDNIQKAIDVVESKMIDLLSTPTEGSNADAFNAMEKEITRVLKMIGETKKPSSSPAPPPPPPPLQPTMMVTMVKMEAEKDDNSEGKSPKLRRGVTMVRRPLVEVKNEKEEEKKDEKKKVKKNEELRRAANIEEGERLLGQVDSVIRKIDSIYTKFYDDNKIKKLHQNEKTTKMLDTFNDVKETPTEMRFKIYENIAYRYQEPKVYLPKKIFHEAKFEERKLMREAEKKKKEEEQKEEEEQQKKKEEERKKKDEERRKKEEEERKKKEEDWKKIEEWKKKEEEQRKKDEEQKKKNEEEETEEENEMKKGRKPMKVKKIINKIKANVNENLQRQVGQLIDDTKSDIYYKKSSFFSFDNRHASTLKAFYALFFSGVFLALNIDCVA